MRFKTWLIAFALVAGVAVPSGWAEEEPSQPSGQSATKPDQGQTAYSPQEPGVMIAAMPVFVPPNRGSPMARLGGATRSAGTDALPRIEALVPETAGWTLREQPVLYWYLAEPTDVRVDFVLLRLDPMETLVETTLDRPQQAGVQRLRLADHGAKLETGASYQWLIKLVPNPEDRSYDRVVGGGIERVEPSAELGAQLADPQPSRAHVLAKAGIWYDAVDALSIQLESAPGDRALWNQRAALFEQVGLPEIALDNDAAPGFGRR